ncbi:MAG: hypothetical protein ACJAVK_001225, partial [Akkermansiaceae bacterium]
KFKMIEELSRSKAKVIGPQARPGQLAEAPPCSGQNSIDDALHSA